ncbi:uncharacterized protein BO97DRAFT_478400 [Aspergillus homomorphus CBS 101889]|uniref:Uncharacterized protein n=1 Tax=Aspergillus homomorphus (strain CBS 101889) TaxID=1450537 RepID=A0A395HV35_ASPHC|nr:hypothetical protein BO97DRAFT_478400 [Aspergillus homomorphus CBS 101889]RAL11667.1 hypothetical protein BO97DRAFT_478400 [Aspergillus homomorphus CBS 101889]
MDQSHEAYNSSPFSAPIPAFAEPLAPYLKSRQEALRIRQALTAYVRSHIIFAENDPDDPDFHAKSHLTLSVPHDAVVGVKRIPPEITGLRREYLEALQANVDARKGYQAALDKHTTFSSERQQTAASKPRSDPSLDLAEYVKLLRDRRQNAKLQVFQRYLQELKERNRRRAESFVDIGKRPEVIVPPEMLCEESRSSSDAGDSVEDLMHRLEKAVIRAKTHFDREKELLEELKEQRALDEDPLPDSTPAAKATALQRTRDELVYWVEEKLVSAGSHEDSGSRPDLAPEDLEESVRLFEEQKAEVAKKYAEYVDARKAVLDAASRACQPIAVPSAPPSSRPTSIIQRKDASQEPQSLGPMDVLPYAEKNLLPLLKSQRALALQKFYLAGLLGKEKATSLRMLNRLRDESHLLPEFPIVANQPRSNRAAAALSSRHVPQFPEPNKKDEVIALADAWAFASDEAGICEDEFVGEKLTEGCESAQKAKQALDAVCRSLNQDTESTLPGNSKGKQGMGDVWPSEARMTRSRTKLERSEPQRKGPWAGLNGAEAGKNQSCKRAQAGKRRPEEH